MDASTKKINFILIERRKKKSRNSRYRRNKTRSIAYLAAHPVASMYDKNLNQSNLPTKNFMLWWVRVHDEVPRRSFINSKIS
ncbi:unnamed protein product [Blumeria hordei]|uniref:Uncharacterized protein n=1 Tax=Blumeria hordei TaxID=2867405 RepID=A0A383UYK3_BLUHO|nr:unnamed protein product [Blumeria hordei]